MASLVARALMEDLLHGEEHDPRRGIDRVLLAIFWRPSSPVTPAAVISLSAPRAAIRPRPSRG